MKIKYPHCLFLLVLTNSCVKSYTPKAIEGQNSYLVISGFINATPNAITTFTLTYSKNLTDTLSSFYPATMDQVSIISKSGSVYNLIDTFNTGVYGSALLTLNQSDQYQLKIVTPSGDQFQSDFVPVKITPPIDSINWQQQVTGVSFFVNSHDPNNATHYYKWDYVETWEHDAPLKNDVSLKDGSWIYYLDSDIYHPDQINRCWTSELASHINVGTSVALSSDVISQQPVTTIIPNDERLTIRYSLLLNQYAITEDAYNYWLLVEKNSQSLGSLFDPQPSQLTGNIHSTINPNEPVIGYISACTLTKKRIFVSHSNVTDWVSFEPYLDCNVTLYYQNPTNFQLWDYPDTSFVPYYFTGGGGLWIAKKYCLDCRDRGGTNIKPPFW